MGQRWHVCYPYIIYFCLGYQMTQQDCTFVYHFIDALWVTPNGISNDTAWQWANSYLLALQLGVRVSPYIPIYLKS